jgi:Protein of unknown function (DUF3240)
MTTVDSKEVLVILTVTRQLEEVVVDWLLSRRDATGFTSFPVAGHSVRHDSLSAAEQVTGRQRRQQFQVRLPASAVESFLDDAAVAIGAAGVQYWVVPLIAGGHLGEP